MYRFFYALSPKRYKKWVEKHVEYCDFTIAPINLIGFMILFGIGLSFTVAFLLFLFKLIATQLFFIVWFIGFIGFEFIIHATLVLVADSRANFVEQILPDALQIISANMRSGLTPDKAILTSARPEFGPLEQGLKRVAKETISGRPFEESLRGIATKIKSKILEKTVNLFIEGTAKGGSITSLLDSIADDIRQIRILRKEMKSYVMMYGMFIFFAVGIGAPLLYSVSTYMIQTLTSIGSIVGIEELLPAASAVPFFKFRVSEISSDFLITYSYIAIFITTVFGSLLIGLIQEGSEKAGLKFIPVLTSLGFATFFLSQIALKTIFGILLV